MSARQAAHIFRVVATVCSNGGGTLSRAWCVLGWPLSNNTAAHSPVEARESFFNATLTDIANSTHMVELKGTTAGPSTIGFDNEEEVALLELFDADKDGRMSAAELHTLKWMLSRIHEGHEVCSSRCMQPIVVGWAEPALDPRNGVSFTSQKMTTTSKMWTWASSRTGAVCEIAAALCTVRAPPFSLADVCLTIERPWLPQIPARDQWQHCTHVRKIGHGWQR